MDNARRDAAEVGPVVGAVAPPLGFDDEVPVPEELVFVPVPDDVLFVEFAVVVEELPLVVTIPDDDPVVVVVVVGLEPPDVVVVVGRVVPPTVPALH